MGRRSIGSLATVMIVPILIGLSACTNASPAAATTASPSPKASYDPAARAAAEAANPDPNFDYGYTVQVTPEGMHPHWLVAACCKALTFKNMTGAPITIVFDHLQVNSGPIPPGGSFDYTPANVQSITYHAGTQPSAGGVVQVNQNFES